MSIVWKGIVVSVLSVANGPGLDWGKSNEVYLLHPQHLRVTDFASFLKGGIQYVDLTFVIVINTPKCILVLSDAATIFSANTDSQD